MAHFCGLLTGWLEFSKVCRGNFSKKGDNISATMTKYSRTHCVLLLLMSCDLVTYFATASYFKSKESFFCLQLIQNYKYTMEPKVFLKSHNCNFTRSVVVVDDISLEALAWIVWLCSICFLQSLYWITILVFFCGRIFTYFCELEPPDDNRRSRRTVRKEFISKGRMPMMAVDQRYMILSGFVLHRYISFMFSSTIKWEVYVRGLQSNFHFLTWSTYRTFRDNLPAWPPDGYIMAVVVFFGLILFHVVVLVTSVLQITSFRFRKLFLRLHRFSTNIRSHRHFLLTKSYRCTTYMPRFV